MNAKAAARRASGRPAVPRRVPRRGRLLQLLLYFSLSLAGVFFFLVAASRRQRFDRSWEALGEFEPPEPEIPAYRPPPTVHPVAREIDGPAGRLFVEDGGVVSARPPVLFVHGLGGTSGQWRAQLSHLRSTRRALALDLRGHGDSAPGQGYTIADYASDVAAAADALGLDRFVLAGHSLGASVAIEYAGHHPGRLAGLLLVDPNGDQTKIPREELDPFLESLARDPQGEMEWYFKQILVASRPEVADRVLADLALAPPQVLRSSLESSFAYCPLPALTDYGGPVLSIIGDMNSLPYSLHNLVEGLPHRLIPGTSHWVMMDEPEELNEVMDAFLASLP